MVKFLSWQLCLKHTLFCKLFAIGRLKNAMELPSEIEKMPNSSADHESS